MPRGSSEPLLTPAPPGSVAVCPYHGALAQRLEDFGGELDREREERRENEGKLFAALGKFERRVSHMEGRIAGYVIAGSILAAILGLVGQWALKHG